MNDVNTLSELQRDEPAVLKWLEDNHKTRDFAASVRGFLARKGYITRGQLAAVLDSVQRDSQPQPEAPSVDATRLEAAFASAKASGLKSPALHIGKYRFSPAPVTGKNPGAVYVKEDGVYLGKMLAGRFMATITGAFVDEVLAIASDPEGEAIKHGRLTGRCAVCSRKLTDPESVPRAMGPVCAVRFGWS